MKMNNFQTNSVAMYSTNQNVNNVFKALLFMVVVALFALTPEFAHAGLAAAQSGAQTFLNDIQPVIRIVCIIGVIFCGLAYMNEWVDNRKLFKICAGLVIIASATELVNLLW